VGRKAGVTEAKLMVSSTNWRSFNCARSASNNSSGTFTGVVVMAYGARGF
jgi:hypothetical protein